MRRVIPEKVKNIIIILLVVSAVLLAWESRLFGNSSVKLSGLFNMIDDKAVSSDNSGAQADEQKTTGQARPISIAVTGSDGSHFGAKYDMAEVGSIYDKTVQLFGEALVSSHVPDEIDEQTWRESLESPGIYFEFMSPIPLSILHKWLSAEVTAGWAELSVRRLCLAAKSGRSILYFQDTDGKFYAKDTDVATDKIVNLTETKTQNKAFFAYEKISTALKDPYSLLIPEISEHPLINATNPLTDEIKVGVLQYFGVSEHQMPIINADGSQDYIDPDFTIKLSLDGTVIYELTKSQEAPPALLDESAAIELARHYVSALIGSNSGDARIYYDAVSSRGAGSYVVFFRYVIAGGPIHLGQDGYAAAVTIENGVISQAELRFRSYAVAESSGETEILPEIQAAAAVGGALMLCYYDNGGASLEPSWIVW